MVAAGFVLSTGASAAVLKATADHRDAAGIDYDRNGRTTSTRYYMDRPSIEVGETPRDGNDLRIFYPFQVTNEMLDAVAGGGSATVSLRVESVAQLGSQRLAIDAYSGGPLNQDGDFDRRATPLARIKPSAGGLGVDVTGSVRAMRDPDFLVLRVGLDGLAPKDGARTVVTMAMSESDTAAYRPLLTVTGAPETTPPPTTPATTAPTTPATTTPPTTPPPTSPPVVPTEPSSASAGTTPGASRYPVPSGAIVVSPTGDDGAPGTVSAPLATLTRAVGVANAGDTIVLRGGSYHESVPFYKRVTIQSWPGEAAWLDGSVPVAGWNPSNGRWAHDGWAIDFDTSPTYTRGAPDSTQPYWGFVNAQHPLAAHPDQLWIDGVAQRQVGSVGEVVPGTFFLDRAANRLWLGSDPNGHDVRASDLVRALMIRADGATVRGIGIRRYAPSVPDMGAVTVERPNVLIENVAVTDSATTGIHVGSGTTPNVTLRNVEVARSGMLGINASQADGITLDRVVSEDNNLEHFNTSPVSGGAKIGRTRGVTVENSVFRGNDGPGLWLDESVYDMTITGNQMTGNSKHGTSLEISAKAVFANNTVTDNGGFGVKINNTSDVAVWNNSFSGNDRSVNVVQDSRRPTSATTAGRDKRQPFPDPTMTWLNGPVTVANNVIANQRSGSCMLCVEDYSQQRSAAQMGITANANLYYRPSASSPTNLVVWSRGAGNPAVYPDVNTFRAATGQEAMGQLIDGVPLLGAAVAATPIVRTGLPLPAAVAQAIGVPTGTRARGVFPSA